MGIKIDRYLMSQKKIPKDAEEPLYQNQCSNQEQVSLHSRCVPGSKLKQTTFSEKLVGRVDNFLISNHLIDLQQPLQLLLKETKDGEKTIKLICMEESYDRYCSHNRIRTSFEI